MKFKRMRMIAGFLAMVTLCQVIQFPASAGSVNEAEGVSLYSTIPYDVWGPGPRSFEVSADFTYPQGQMSGRYIARVDVIYSSHQTKEMLLATEEQEIPYKGSIKLTVPIPENETGMAFIQRAYWYDIADYGSNYKRLWNNGKSKYQAYYPPVEPWRYFRIDYASSLPQIPFESADNPREDKEFSPPPAPEIPSGQGYLFTGWYTQPVVGETSLTPVSFPRYPYAHTTYYAGWKPITYSVAYNGNGGSGSMANSTHTFDAAASLSPNGFTRPGYAFVGWSTNPNDPVAYSNGQSVSNLSATNNDTVTLYARWEKMNAVEFDANGVQTTAFPTTQYVSNGGSVSVPATPRANGHTFENWYTDAACTIRYNFSDPVTSDMTLFAKWTPHIYSIQYNANGGSGSMSDSTLTYGVPQTLPSNTFTKDKHIFVGWSTTPNGSALYTDGQSVSNLSATNNDTVTLYAVWKRLYEVTFDANGFNAQSLPDAQIVPDGQTATMPSAPTTTGHTFENWYTDAACSTGYNFSDPVTADMTLYAKWTPHTYSIQYNANGGSGSMSDSAHTYDEVQKLAENLFNRVGYTFLGWALTADGNTEFSDSEPVKNLSAENGGLVPIYAKWTPHTYNIRYDANGGSGSMSDSTHTYDVSQELNRNTYTRKGYTFSGWALTADGTTQYADTESVTNLSADNGDLVTLFAVWEPIPAEAPIIVEVQGSTGVHTYQQGDLTVSVAATAAEDHDLSYQWYTADGTEIPAATSASYSISASATVGTHEYYCQVTATRTDNGLSATESSANAAVIITMEPPVIDYHAEELVLPERVEYRVQDGEWQTAADISASIPSYGDPDAEIEYRVQEQDGTSSPSETLHLPARRKAPQIIPTILKSDSTISVTNLTDYSEDVEYSIGDIWNTTGSFTGLPAKTQAVLCIRYSATDALFASEQLARKITTLNEDGSGTLEQGESVVIDGVTAENDGHNISFGDVDITLPLDVHEVDVDHEGVFVPDNTVVTTPKIVVKLPDGGKVLADGTIIADGTLVVGDYTIIAPDDGKIIVHPDGTITVPEGTVIKVADKEITVPGGDITLNEDGTLTLPNGATLYPDGRYVGKSRPNRPEPEIKTVKGNDALPFVDVGTDDWYYSSVAYAYSNGLMEGTSEITFEPEADTSRAMIVTALSRAADATEDSITAVEAFADVDSSAWYAHAVAWGVQNGVVKGYGDDTFAPQQAITREELAAVLYRHINGLVKDTSVLNEFTDSEDVESWAVEAVAWAVENEILQGDNDNLHPKDTATRAQVAAILMRIAEKTAGDLT